MVPWLNSSITSKRIATKLPVINTTKIGATAAMLTFAVDRSA